MQIHEFDAIGTHWAIEVISAQEFTDELIATIHDTVDLFDQRYSRFREDSLIAELARKGVVINPPTEMLEMLDFAKDMYDISDGAFTIAVGATLHRMGYGKRVHGREINRTLWDEIVYSREKIVIPKGEMLDFGGFGKGWLVDKIVEILREADMKEFIVNGGGDLYCQSETPIEFRLEDSRDEMKQFGQTRITSGALAVSNTIKRTWHDGDESKHHIIDPVADDSSDSGVIATYIRADTALVADTMATILILRPDCENMLKTRYGLKTIVVHG
ncbi:MAG: FAD:protein FMN transferase [Candidatus Saccharimonas sp.]